MDLTITGEVTDVLAEETGTGKNGVWRKQSFILKTQGQYPKDVHVIQWGDSIDKFAVQSGETITAHIDIQSREYNGRWYTDVKAWKIARKEDGGDNRRNEEEPPLPDAPDELEEDGHDLPF